MKIKDVERRCTARPTINPPPTVSSPVIWTKGKVNLPIPRNPAKPQITLLHLGLHPIGKGALVVTGGPVGTGADGRFRRLKVGLCIMWLAIAVTVSLLSLPLRGSDPHHPSYLQVGLRFFPLPSRNRPVWWTGMLVMWKVTLLSSLQPTAKFMLRSHLFVSSLNHLWDLISWQCYIHNVISWLSADLINLEDGWVLICCKIKQAMSMKGHCLFDFFNIYIFQRGFSEQEKSWINIK